MRNAFLLDIDGTICNSQYPISYLNGERETNNYKTYYRLLDVVTPIEPVIELVHSEVAKTIGDLTLVVLTGRSAERHAIDSTLEFMGKYYDSLLEDTRISIDYYFRPLNLHCPSVQYKREKFIMLQQMYNFLQIYEDEASNVNMFHALKPSNCIIHHIVSSYDFSLEAQEIAKKDTSIITHHIS